MAAVRALTPEPEMQAYVETLQRWNAAKEHISALYEDANPAAYCEDSYRDVGRFYYRGAWSAAHYHGNERLESSTRSMIADALDGNRTDRAFFYPWREVEDTLKSALDYLEDKDLSKWLRVEMAQNECFSAISKLIGIERALGCLIECVEVADRIDLRFYGQHLRNEELRRTQAFWAWLSSLPETRAAMRVGRKKEDLLEEARRGYEDTRLRLTIASGADASHDEWPTVTSVRHSWVEQLRALSRTGLVNIVKCHIEGANRNLNNFEDAYRAAGLDFYFTAHCNRHHATLATHPSVLIAREDFSADHPRFMETLNVALDAYRQNIQALDRLITLGEPRAFDCDEIVQLMTLHANQGRQFNVRHGHWQLALMAMMEVMATFPLSIEELEYSAEFRVWLQTLPEVRRLLALNVPRRQIIERLMINEKQILPGGTSQ
ncbi:hypothetical protein BDV96DRAFT_688387 [Lophiotrema nucula]|uniref:Uncharacterized protein n=1 Tax=Lophiotrema nucula TaxID=690887 RepID=A0A6A5Z6Y4_9PLEO|nr:hypothetical protein BDV96DRAFT_688387 [Lophiotrema nucula]